MAENYTSPLNKRIVGQRKRKARISRLTGNQTFCDDKHLGEKGKNDGKRWESWTSECNLLLFFSLHYDKISLVVRSPPSCSSHHYPVDQD